MSMRSTAGPSRRRPAFVHGLRRRALAVATLLCASGWPGASAAFDPDLPSATSGPTARAAERVAPLVPRIDASRMEWFVHWTLPSPLEDRPIPTAIQQIGERLRRLPFRPVSIGEEPRTPDDPEPGAGMTFFIRF